MREKIAGDLANHLGLERDEISTDYVAWTGDPGDDPGCLPGNSNYLSGHLAISKRLASYGPSSSNRLFVVIGWSNGGATATQLSKYLHNKDQPQKVDLLVTLDPVSQLTDRPRNSFAETWLNVYTASSCKDKLRSDNIIAVAGGAWDEFKGPTLVECMKGNHGEAERMWRAVIIRSSQFKEWSSQIRSTLGTEQSIADDSIDMTYESCRTTRP